MEALKPTLTALAEAIAEQFPELGGRSIAVSEIKPFNDRTNIPTLPIAVIALVKETGMQNPRGGGRLQLEADIIVHFMFKPVKYQNAAEIDTPFFAYYDYEAIRDRLLDLTGRWRSPRNTGLSFRSVDVESDEYAVYIAFRFGIIEEWCNPVTQGAPGVVEINYHIFKPAATVCLPCEQDEEEPEDPCQAIHIVNGIEQEN